MNGPYAGLNVLDLTRVLAGPYCTMMLADMGAAVIKVEVPETGDDARAYGPFINGKSAYFTSLNRGKHSIALDLRADSDRRTFESLLAQTDILVENYRGGTMEKLGFGFASLAPRFPRLIYVAISGFGHSGPYRTRAAYDMVVQGMGGVMSLTGHPGGPPARVGTSIGDLAAALFGLGGIGAALYHREKTGQGQKLDIAMLDCQVALLENAIARYAATGKSPGPLGARHPSITPFGAFKTADKPIIIAAGNNALFVKLCETLGQKALCTDPLFGTNDARSTNQDTLTQLLEQALMAKPAAHWLTRLEDAGVPAGPINDVAAVLSDPHILSRNMVVALEDAGMGAFPLAGNPLKSSAFEDPSSRAKSPALDEHGAEIRKHGFAALRALAPQP